MTTAAVCTPGPDSRSSARQLAAMASRSMVRVAVAMRGLFRPGAAAGQGKTCDETRDTAGACPSALPARQLSPTGRVAMSSDDQDHASGDEDADLYLTILCWIGLGLATLSAFVQPLPAGPGLGRAGAGLPDRRASAAADGLGRTLARPASGHRPSDGGGCACGGGGGRGAGRGGAAGAVLAVADAGASGDGQGPPRGRGADAAAPGNRAARGAGRGGRGCRSRIWCPATG